MVDFTIALFLQLGLLLLLGRSLPGNKPSRQTLSWPTGGSFQPSWEAAERMIEREYGSSSL